MRRYRWVAGNGGKRTGADWGASDTGAPGCPVGELPNRPKELAAVEAYHLADLNWIDGAPRVSHTLELVSPAQGHRAGAQRHRQVRGPGRAQTGAVQYRKEHRCVQGVPGKLPPAHIHARVKRWAVKLFLAHYHHVAWTLAIGAPPPKPYVIAVLGHADFIAPPNFPTREV